MCVFRNDPVSEDVATVQNPEPPNESATDLDSVLDKDSIAKMKVIKFRREGGDGAGRAWNEYE